MALAGWGASVEIPGATYWYETVSTAAKTIRLVGANGHSYRVPEPTHVVSSSLTIKETTYTVTELGSGALTNLLTLTKVTVPASVTKILTGAIVGCAALETVSFKGDSVTLNSAAFWDCPALTNFATTASNPTYSIADGLMLSQDGLTLVRCPPGRTTVTIPDSVTSLKSFAFDGSAITALHLPAAVTSVSYQAFPLATKLAAFTVAADNARYSAQGGVLFDKTGTTLECCPPTRTTLDIPAGVTNIVDYALLGCKVLREVTCPATLTHLNVHPFDGATALETITFFGDVPENFTTYAGGIARAQRATVTVRYPVRHATAWSAALADTDFTRSEAFTPSTGLVFSLK